MDPVLLYESQGPASRGKLRCPVCTSALTSGGETRGLVPRTLEPCGCVTCTSCAVSLASKPPFECPVHQQKLLLPGRGQFRRAQNVIAAIILLENLRKKAAITASATAPTTQQKEPSGIASQAKESRPLDGSFAPLIHLLGRFDSPCKQECALKALHDLTVHPVNADELTCSGGIPPLVRILAAGAAKLKAAAARTLKNCAVASANGRQQVEVCGGVPIMVKLLQSHWLSSGPSKAVQEAAVLVLHEIAGQSSVSDKVVEAGGIKLLIRLMKHGTANAKALAAGTLGKLAIDINLLVKMASQGSIPPLVRLRSSGTPNGQENAANLLSRFAEVPANHDAMLRGQAVSQLMQTLSRGSPAVQEIAVKGLASIANSPMKAAEKQPSLRLAIPTLATAMRRSTLSTGSPRLGVISPVVSNAGVPALLQMVRTGNAGVQQQAMAVLRDLAFAPEHRYAIATAERAIPLFVDILAGGSPQMTCVYAASCLRSLALNESWAEKIGEAGAIPQLVALLNSNLPEAHDCAVGALTNLAVNMRCKELIGDAHAIPLLLKLLSSSGLGGIQEMAVGTLTNLAVLPANQVQIAAAGGIPLLVKRLELPSEEAQANAAGALWSLAQDVDNQARISHWGGVEKLATLLYSGSQAAKMNAMGALRYLAEHEATREKIKAAGGIPPLVKTFVHAWAAAPELQEIACKCLLNLSISTENQIPVIEEGCLPAATRFLLRGSLVAQEYSAGLLLNLATNSRARAAIAQSGAVAALVHVLENSSAQAQGNAVEALRNLSVDAACCRQIVQASQGRGISMVVQQLCSMSMQTTVHAASIIANLAACNQQVYHDSLAKAGALPLLLQLLKCSLGEQAAALGALRNLSANLKWQVDLASCEAVPLILQGLKHPDVDSRECVAAAVGNFAAGNCSFKAGTKDVAIISLLLEAIPSLVRLCQKIKPGPGEECAASAAGALWRLMAADGIKGGREAKDRITAAEGSAALQLLLKVGSSRTKENASKALNMLAAKDSAIHIAVSAAPTVPVGVNNSRTEQRSAVPTVFCQPSTIQQLVVPPETHTC